MKIPVLLLLCSLGAVAEVKTITLRQAIDLALAQSPDLMIVRLDQQKARDQVSIAHDAFVPKVYGGSGAAWTSGFPSSIEGNAPSIFQAKTQMALYDRPQSYQVAQANEMVRGARWKACRGFASWWKRGWLRAASSRSNPKKRIWRRSGRA